MIHGLATKITWSQISQSIDWIKTTCWGFHGMYKIARARVGRRQWRSVVEGREGKAGPGPPAPVRGLTLKGKPEKENPSHCILMYLSDDSVNGAIRQKLRVMVRSLSIRYNIDIRNYTVYRIKASKSDHTEHRDTSLNPVY